MTLVVSLAAGLLIGIILGALGGGGGIMTVPVLIFLVGMPAADATTASLIIVGISSAVALVSHAKNGNVRWGTALAFALLGYVGNRAGVIAAHGVSEDVLLLGFAGLLVVVATLMWRKAGRKKTTPPVPRPPVITPGTLRIDWRRAALLVTTAIGVGCLVGFFGVGGGFAIVPALALIMGLPMRQAIGTSLAVIVVMSADTLATKLAFGIDLPWVTVAVFTAAAMAGSVIGPRVGAKLDPIILAKCFATLMAAVAISMSAGVFLR